MNHYAKHEAEPAFGKRVAAWIGLLFLLFLMVVVFWTPLKAQQGQTNTFNVAQFRGADVGQKMANAEAACLPDTAVPCTLIIDSVLAVWPQGTMPAKCSNCTWVDYRTGMMISATNNIQYADTYKAGSSTCGIQEAVNTLPSQGGSIQLPFGTCQLTSAVTVNKPVRFIGWGGGGIADVVGFNTYLCTTLLQNGTTGADLISVSIPASNSLENVSFEHFCIQGNKAVTNVTAGSDIALNGGSSPSVNLRRVGFTDVFLVDAKDCGLKIAGNAYMIFGVDIATYRNNSHGVCVVDSGTGIAGQESFVSLRSDLNSADALNINSTHAGTFDCYGCTFSDSTNGVQVAVGSVNANFHCSGCNFEKNTNAGALLLDGYNHVIEKSTFPADGTQLFGVSANMPSGANFVNNQVTLKNNVFGANLTKDVSFGSNMHVCSVEAQGTNQSGYSYQDTSGSCVVEDLFQGEKRITGKYAFGSGAAFTEGSPSGAAAGRDVCQGNSTNHILQCSFNSGSFFNMTQTVANGTATMTTASIAAGACGTTVTVPATGVVTTDVIITANNAAVAAPNGLLRINYWPTAGNVNFNYCNPTAGSLTPTSATLNWSATR